jgi:hypothetical protein
MMFKRWLEHAFAVNNTPAEPTPVQLAVVDKLCQEVVRRRLTPAALAFLEMSRPLNFLGAQSLHFFAPLISAIAQGNDHIHLAAFLERRDAVSRICGRIEWYERIARSAAGESSSDQAASADSTRKS